MDIQQVKEKLSKLIDLDPVGTYGYIYDPLSEEAVSEFENKHNIKLPGDFRTFVTSMFDGGVGPEQLMPLEFWDSVHNCVDLGCLGNKLCEPFLLTHEWTDNFEPDDFERNEYNAIVNGTIRLCHIGCGNFLFLVVNGSEYGNIWIDDRASNNEIVPLSSTSSRRITFEQWYNDWLDKQIAYYEDLRSRPASVEVPRPAWLNANSDSAGYLGNNTDNAEKYSGVDFWAILKRWIFKKRG